MVGEKGSTFSIGALAKASGYAPSAIRYYESLGLISASRSSGGQRRYDEDALIALKYIAFAQASGFTLSEITNLNRAIKSGDPLFAHWQALAERKLTELDEVIKRAEEMKRLLRYSLDCRCTNVDDCGLLVGRAGR